MPLFEVLGYPLLCHFHDTATGTYIIGKHPFQCFLYEYHLGLCRDQGGIAPRCLPIGHAKVLRGHAPTVTRHLPPLDLHLPVGGANHLDFFCDLFDAVPAHVNAITGLRVAFGGRLFKTHAPDLMLPAVVELESNISGSLGVGTIAVRRLTNLDQAPRYAFVVIKLIRALTSIGNRTSSTSGVPEWVRSQTSRRSESVCRSSSVG